MVTEVTSQHHTALADLASGDGTGGVVRLVVLGTGPPVTHTLPGVGEVVLGRAEHADVRIDEDGISRRHALLCLGERITLEDLGSLNGTRVRDRSLRKGEVEELAPGEAFELGQVMCIVQRRAAAPERPPRRRLRPHSYIEARLDEELDRRGGVGVWLARLGCVLPEGDPLPPAAVEQALAGALGSHDIAGEYGPGELEVIFVDGSWDDVERRCERLVTALRALGATVTVGVAAAPRDGRTGSALYSHANAKARGKRALDDDHAPVTRGAMERLKRLVERVARSEISVVLHGETGVGKEVLAKEIHRASERARHPFVGINCAALTEPLLESELFGHEKGAFSGAMATKPGLFEVAERGTVFLDEIVEMSLPIQAKLLRVLEERQVLRVGGLSPRAIDVRFVAASHHDLEEAVDAGRFRQDLYFRLNGITLEIPPLRERTEEIEGLTRQFLVDASKRARRDDVPNLAPEALDLLKTYAWPGNVRELRNVVERAVLLAPGATITLEHLPSEKMLAQKRSRPSPNPAPVTQTQSPKRTPGTGLPRGALSDGPSVDDRRHPAAFDDIPQTAPALGSPVATGRGERGERVVRLRDAMEDMERQRILDALRACGGNQTRTAEVLGISRRTLLNRLDQYGVPRPRK